ncbi:serine/threonine-protein kinase [Saccharomonospora xinjiangensis]|uniref:serine/threonine-protein kinase n=1 Tax=Saccharomonospora xinjiangensis TaxID=75294 RepID=UPI00350EF7F7
MTVKPLAPHDPQRVGPYLLLRSLGEGGMGRVLLAVGPDGRPAAVKIVHASLARDPVFRERFRREVEACRRVSGAYTAPVLAADPGAPVPWLATLYVPGPSLRQVVADTGVLPLPSLHRLAVGLTTALADIHRAGLVHRDLKPGNVLLTHDGPRVIDFGIARAVTDDVELTSTGSVIGSPEFMSPEQAHGHALTSATDVFSLGSVLVLAATGRSPFAGSSAAQTLYNVAHAEADLTGVPSPLREIVAACLDKEAQRRPTAHALLDRLAEIGTVAPGAAPWPPAVHEAIGRQEAEAGRVLAATPRSAMSARRRTAPAVWSGVAAVLVIGVAATVVALAGGGDSGDGAGGAAAGDPGSAAVPTALPGNQSTTANAEPDDDPLGVSALRGTDPCAVLAREPDLTARPAVHLSRCTYEHEDGRWFDLALGDAVPATPNPGDDVDDTELDGLSLVVDHGGEGRCEVVAVLPSDPGLGVSVEVGPGVGAVVARPCAEARDRLAVALDRLTDGGAKRDPDAGSLANVDPCSLIDTNEIVDIFTVNPAVVPDGLHGCEWAVSGTLTLQLAKEVDPAALPDDWEKRRLGAHTVYLQRDPQPGSPSCAVAWAHRPSEESFTETVTLRYRATATGLPVEEVCAATRSAAEHVVARLPKP